MTCKAKDLWTSQKLSARERKIQKGLDTKAVQMEDMLVDCDIGQEEDQELTFWNLEQNWKTKVENRENKTWNFGGSRRENKKIEGENYPKTW